MSTFRKTKGAQISHILAETSESAGPRYYVCKACLSERAPGPVLLRVSIESVDPLAVNLLPFWLFLAGAVTTISGLSDSWVQFMHSEYGLLIFPNAQDLIDAIQGLAAGSGLGRSALPEILEWSVKWTLASDPAGMPPDSDRRRVLSVTESAFHTGALTTCRLLNLNVFLRISFAC